MNPAAQYGLSVGVPLSGGVISGWDPCRMYCPCCPLSNAELHITGVVVRVERPCESMEPWMSLRYLREESGRGRKS